jgi:signal peptidase I
MKKLLLTILTLLLLVSGCSKVSEDPELFAGHFVIVGVSMNPVLYENDIVMVEPLEFEKVVIGDVIVFEHRGTLIAHRVIRINQDGNFITKGDNPRARQDPFPISRISYRGRVMISR